MKRPFRMCSVDGCLRKHHTHGLCAAHWSRKRRLGDVLADKPIGWRLEIVHGTYDGYLNHGCRCDECRQAHTDYMRIRNHRTGRCRPRAEVFAERRATAEARGNHGTESRYELGCRCTVCREGVRQARARRRAKATA